MNTLLKTSVCAFLLAAVVAARRRPAAEVRAGISTRETYVGMPVTFQVRVANATDFDPPTVPEIPGPADSISSATVAEHANHDHQWQRDNPLSVTYSFSLTPTQPGNFRIPAIKVHADGENALDPAVRVRRVEERNGRPAVRRNRRQREADLRRPGARPDAARSGSARTATRNTASRSAKATCGSCSPQRTNWGPFAERDQAVADNNQRPVGTEVLRKDRDGANHSYYLYEIDAHDLSEEARPHRRQRRAGRSHCIRRQSASRRIRSPASLTTWAWAAVVRHVHAFRAAADHRIGAADRRRGQGRADRSQGNSDCEPAGRLPRRGGQVPHRSPRPRRPM